MSIPRDGLNALPAELLCKIFRIVILGGNSEQSRCRLVLVCRQWREYVEGSALFWTNIAAFDGLATTRQALERSKGAKLNLRYRLHWGNFVNLKAFMAEVGPHIARWRSLVVGLERGSSPSPSENQLVPLTTTQAPSLEILRLFSNGRKYSVTRNAITVFGGAPAPSTLKELALERIPMAIEPLKLSGLVSLHLTMVPTITTPHILEILRRSPSLERLGLNGNARLVALGSEASNIRPIELPKLDYLSLSLRYHDGSHYILSNIRIPNCRSVLIRGDVSWANAMSVFFTSAIAHLLHTTIPTADVRPSVISVEGQIRGGYKIKFRGIEIGPFMYGEDRLHVILRWLADGLGSEAAQCPVYLVLGGSDGCLIPLATVSPPFIVKHLSFSDPTSGWVRKDLSISDSKSESLRELYIVMARPSDLTPSGWLYPGLNGLSVRFKSMDSQEQLVSMLRSRYEVASAPGEVELSRPASLRSVELRGSPRTEGLVEEIKRILGEANVFWAEDETA